MQFNNCTFLITYREKKGWQIYTTQNKNLLKSNAFTFPTNHQITPTKLFITVLLSSITFIINHWFILIIAGKIQKLSKKVSSVKVKRMRDKWFMSWNITSAICSKEIICLFGKLSASHRMLTNRHLLAENRLPATM